MTRVSDHAKRCGTAGSFPVQSISATCPVSLFSSIEIDKGVEGALTRGGTIQKDAGHVGHGTTRGCR